MKERKGQPVHVRPSLIARKRIDYAKQFGLSESGFVTLILEQGVDLPTVASWLGHQDRGVLLAECYMHVLTDHSRRMAAKVRIVI